MNQKGRLSVSVDAELIDGIAQAVSAGRAKTTSEWVSRAVRARLDEESRLAAMGDFLSDYEREHGAFTPDERGTGLARLRARTRARATRARKAG